MPGSKGAGEPQPWAAAPNPEPSWVQGSHGEHTERRTGPEPPRLGQSSLWHRDSGSRRGRARGAPSSPPGLGWNVVTAVTCSRLVGMLEIFVPFLPSSSLMVWEILPCSRHLPEPLPATRCPPGLSLLAVERVLQGGGGGSCKETLPCLPGRSIPCCPGPGRGLAQAWQQLEGPVELQVSPHSPRRTHTPAKQGTKTKTRPFSRALPHPSPSELRSRVSDREANHWKQK